MKKIAIILCMMGATCLTKADLVAAWDFNQTPTNPAPTTIAASLGAEAGTASLDLSHLSSGDDATIGSTSSGTSVNKVSGDVNGESLYIVGGTDKVENGKSIIFTLDMSGYQSLVLTYATDRSSYGFDEQDWSYSIDGGTTFISTATITSISSAFAVANVSFSSAIDDQSSILIELTLKGATSATGSTHFDNIQFNADTYTAPIPEPAGFGLISAIGLLGICGISFLRQRHYRK